MSLAPVGGSKSRRVAAREGQPRRRNPLSIGYTQCISVSLPCVYSPDPVSSAEREVKTFGVEAFAKVEATRHSGKSRPSEKCAARWRAVHYGMRPPTVASTTTYALVGTELLRSSEFRIASSATPLGRSLFPSKFTARGGKRRRKNYRMEARVLVY